MSSNKASFEDSLTQSVVEAGKCLGCGACVVLCPYKSLEYREGRPSLTEECKDCGICAQVCPQHDWSWSKVENFVFSRERKAEEEFGVYNRLIVAQANDDKILEHCQDGGVITALLAFALETGLIDSAVVSGMSQEKPLYPIPRLATTFREILECAGTRYSYSPNIFALAEGVQQKNANIAFVGTPCQIRALRKMQMFGLKKYTKPIKFLIGLMCSECFTYGGLVEKHIGEELGLNLDDLRKINIKGKILIETNSEFKTIPLAVAKQYAQQSCLFCDDFSSELADISAGGLGLDKRTFITIRTEQGEELFSKAEKAGVIKTEDANEEANALRLLRKLSKKKKQRAQRNGSFI